VSIIGGMMKLGKKKKKKKKSKWSSIQKCVYGATGWFSGEW
jgi:hypothetical protein